MKDYKIISNVKFHILQFKILKNQLYSPSSQKTVQLLLKNLPTVRKAPQKTRQQFIRNPLKEILINFLVDCHDCRFACFFVSFFRYFTYATLFQINYILIVIYFLCVFSRNN